MSVLLYMHKIQYNDELSNRRIMEDVDVKYYTFNAFLFSNIKHNSSYELTIGALCVVEDYNFTQLKIN